MIRYVPKIAGHRVLITGINGFIGCHVASVAQREGAEVVGVDLPRPTTCSEKVRASLGAEGIKIHEVEHLDREELSRILVDFKADIVVHLRGITRRDDEPATWTECTQENVMLTVSVLAAVMERPQGSRPVLVMPGSQMEYGLAPSPWTERQVAMPVNPYGASKLAATELLLAAIRAGLVRGCVSRLALVFGPGQAPSMMIPELIGKALNGMDVCITEGKQRRRFVFVGDVAMFLLRIGALLAGGKDAPPLINAPASEPVRIVELAKDLIALMENPVRLQVGSLIERSHEPSDAWLDSALAESMDLITLTPMEKGLAETVLWYRENEWFVKSMLPTGRE